MKIIIHRYDIRKITCDGLLSIEGKSICSTSEHAKHRIPVGTYRIILRHSKLHGRKVPMLVPLDSKAPPASSPPCLCIGNGIFATKDGRIILGIHIAPGCVKDSNLNFKLLYDRIYTSLHRGHDVTLEITEAEPGAN